MRIKGLRVARAEVGLTQLEVARQTGISANRYWRIENGYAVATDDERARLSALFQRPADHLLDSAA